MNSIKYLLLLSTALTSFSAAAQKQPDYNAASIRQMLHKVNTLGTVLYIAAHPDDENTRFIAYMANEEHYRTGYLSLTRGDGGQNLIGTEKGALMGLLRTQELLEARRLDGGEQFFTRAVDFGYSKTPDETFDIWEKEKILADVIWTIRKFRPDVLVTRFPPTSRAGHGHHTASAMLAEEVFNMAADPNVFPEQLEYVDVWQPKRLYHNTSTWWYKDLPEKAKAQPDQYVTVDVGKFNPVLGKSYSEIASESRSMHKSQGFGSGKRRGSQVEYLEYVMGENALENDLLYGVETSWKRVKGGEQVGEFLQKALTEFDAEQPHLIVPHLIEAHHALKNVEDEYWKAQKQQEIETLILACSGVWMEVTAKHHRYATSSTIEATAAVVQRSPVGDCQLNITIGDQQILEASALNENELHQFDFTTPAPDHDSNPYWLNGSYFGIFPVKEQTEIGLPENPAAVMVDFRLSIGKHTFHYQRPIVYKWTDRVDGEIYRPLAIVPAATANIEEKVYIFPDENAMLINVQVENHSDSLDGAVLLTLPQGWECENNSQPVTIKGAGTTANFTFKVRPPENGAVGEVKAVVRTQTESYRKSLITIEYPHAPIQTLLLSAQAKIVRLDIQRKGEHIGYIMGAGDEVPSALEQVGYQVSILDPAQLPTTNLSGFDAILTGIRAFNTQKSLANNYRSLLEYAEKGGTVIVQYNTNRGLVTDNFAPYPLKLSRDRVTKEEAEVTFLAPRHAIMKTPNKLSKEDFDGWVQERGLYFADEWDEQFTPLFSWHDPNEDPKEGGLLVANHGKGAFIYTGISFFRQLPAGVPGAYRLLMNLIAYGQK